MGSYSVYYCVYSRFLSKIWRNESFCECPSILMLWWIWMELSAIKDMTELVQVLVMTCSTTLNSGCHWEGPHPASWRAASIAARSRKIIMDPPGLWDTRLLSRAKPRTVKSWGNTSPNASAPVCMKGVGKDLHIRDLASPADIAGRMICSHCFLVSVVHVRGYSTFFQMVEQSASHASICLRLLALICAAHFCDTSIICSNWAVLSLVGAVLTHRVLRASVTSKCSSSTLSSHDYGLRLMKMCPLLKYKPVVCSSGNIGSGDVSGSTYPHVAHNSHSRVSVPYCMRITSTWKGSPGWPDWIIYVSSTKL
jgi:hypothetical protein